MRKRWQFMGAQDLGEDPYLDRLRVVATPFFSVYLHHISREDRTPAHDHPWWFASLVLTGKYTEMVYPDKEAGRGTRRVHKRFSLHSMKLSQAHRITEVSRPLWTLVLTGPALNENWGFYPGKTFGFYPTRKFVPWNQFEGRETVVAGYPSWKKEGVLK